MNISPTEFVQACDEDDLEDLIKVINKYYKKKYLFLSQLIYFMTSGMRQLKN